MTNELTVVNQSAVMPIMDIQQAKQRRNAIVEFVQSLMMEGQHYGKIPGTNKNTLLKPGAEMLTTFFGLSPRFEVVEKELDWTGDKHNSEAFFYFQYRCSLWRGDLLAGEGLGSCNSWEKKYRWRNASRACPACGKETIIKGKAEYGGGWLCFAKKGGCGAKFGDNDPAIVNQETGQVPNDNPADLVNTLDKMAQKRALVAATLIAVNASEFFTQDVEDMDLSFIDGDFIEVKPQPQQRPQKQKGNGRPPAPAPMPDNELDGALGTKPPVTTGSSVTDIRASLDELSAFTLGIVADRVAMTGLYDNKHHALTAMKEYKFPDGVEVKFSQKVSKGGALQVFDWLLERKQESA